MVLLYYLIPVITILHFHDLKFLLDMAEDIQSVLWLKNRSSHCIANHCLNVRNIWCKQHESLFGRCRGLAVKSVFACVLTCSTCWCSHILSLLNSSLSSHRQARVDNSLSFSSPQKSSWLEMTNEAVRQVRLQQAQVC